MNCTKRDVMRAVFVGITGTVSIDENGDRNADYSLLDMNESGTFEVSDVTSGWLINLAYKQTLLLAGGCELLRKPEGVRTGEGEEDSMGGRTHFRSARHPRVRIRQLAMSGRRWVTCHSVFVA